MTTDVLGTLTTIACVAIALAAYVAVVLLVARFLGFSAQHDDQVES